ncbi:MAG TPA: DUF5808 domain-containing protein [Chthoniobacter sp.]
MLDQFHSDPANWKLGFIYFCRADPRILVPKRIRGLGWTINLARPMAIPCVILVIGAVWGALEFIRFLGVSAESRFLVKLLLAFGIIAACYYLAHRQPKHDPTDSRPAEPPR